VKVRPSSMVSTARIRPPRAAVPTIQSTKPIAMRSIVPATIAGT